MAEDGVSGLATQAAHLTVPWQLCQQQQATRCGQGEDKLDHLMRVPELTRKVLNIRGFDILYYFLLFRFWIQIWTFEQ